MVGPPCTRAPVLCACSHLLAAKINEWVSGPKIGTKNTQASSVRKVQGVRCKEGGDTSSKGNTLSGG